ncbi:MAG: CusA/CzcA family heavy metal efflux RND transporter [Bacteroidales bacterium]|nr:CusA/CzcA family heavy metal efflux RND transporter [Bacteroidales bacterium]
MLENIILFSIRNKLIVILFAVFVIGFGIFSLTQIPIGAVPDITNNQVQVITVSPNLSTQDVEQFITYPVELEMANLPGVLEIRSISKFGLSVVTIVFEDKIGTYLPRQLIAEKIKSASANIPDGFGTPEMGPITTGLGEIYQYILDTKPGYDSVYSVMDLRTIQDWIVRRRLSGIPGVVEINTWGGYLKQYEVAVDPEKLRSMNISIVDVFNAIENNNSVAGGGYIEKTNESYFVRGEGLVKSLDDIRSIVVKNTNGIPVLVRDLAIVRFGHATRFGAITGNGQGEKVLGQIMMLKDGNSNKVISDVKERVAEIQTDLPEGVYINGFLERSELIEKTTLTVSENLILGCLIVIFVVVLLLGNLRSGLVIASVIPLCLLFALSFMYIFGIDANLMSLGAIDFGIIIDGAVIIVEFIAFQINAKQDKIENSDPDTRIKLMDKITFEGASKMMNSAIFGQLIILIVFIPILSLSGVEGKMFKPMALTFSFALVGAMLFCFTWVPVMSAMFLKPAKAGKRNISKIIMKYVEASYDPVIKWAYGHKKIILGMAIAALGFSVFLFTRIGGEFVPTLDEGDFVIQPVLRTGTSLSKTIETTTLIENILLTNFPEVEQVVSRIGAAEVPTDPMSMEETDVIIKLKPRKQWVSAKSKDELADKIKTKLSVIPGVDFEFTQPIEMRFNELITGVRADLAVKVFGEDLSILNQKANEIKDLVSGVEGASDVIVEKTAGLPQMTVRYNRVKLARYGLNVKDLNNLVSMAFSGSSAGIVFEGERRFDLVLRFEENFRQNLTDLSNLYVDLPGGDKIPLNELAEIKYDKGPAKISRDNTQRRVVVGINVRGRDLESVVKDVQSLIDAKIKLPSGYSVSYGGQFENLRSAKARLKLAVPIALFLIFIFLHFAFKSFKEAAMVFSAVPLSAVGGVLFLWIRGIPFSISAGVGFIALFGIAVLNGIVLIEHLKELKEEGIIDMKERVLTATRQRLRPVMLTASAAALGFLPMAISTSAGAEVQRPLATVVIGGLVTSTLLTMIALPLLYAIFSDVERISLFPFRLHKKLILLLAFLGFGSFKMMAQNNEVNMDGAIQIAINNNHELKALELLSFQMQQNIHTAYDIPKTYLFHSLDKNNFGENGLPLKVFGIQQSFQFPTVYSSQKKIYINESRMAEFSFEIKKLNLIRQVSEAYIKICYLENLMMHYAALDTLYGEYTLAAEKIYKSGESNYLESLTARSKQQIVKARLKNVKLDINSAYEEFRSLLQSDSALVVEDTCLIRLNVNQNDIMSNPGLQYYNQATRLSEARIKNEQNKLLPDISIEYFRGSNSGANAVVYPGFQLGVSVPLFFGSQHARIKSSQIGKEISMNEQLNFQYLLESRGKQLRNEIDQLKENLELYEKSSRLLSLEIRKATKLAFEKGEIDFFKLIQSIEAAGDIEIEYLNNLYNYDQKVLEYNYLTF